MKMRIWMVILALVLLLPVVSIVACGDDDDDDDSSSSDDDDDDTVIDDDDDDDDDTTDDDDDDDTTTTTTTVETTTTTTTTIPDLVSEDWESYSDGDTPGDPWEVKGNKTKIETPVAALHAGNYCSVAGALLGSGELAVPLPLDTYPGITSLSLTMAAQFVTTADTTIALAARGTEVTSPLLEIGDIGALTTIRVRHGDGEAGSTNSKCDAPAGQGAWFNIEMDVDLENSVATVTVSDAETSSVCAEEVTLQNDSNASEINYPIITAPNGSTVDVDTITVTVE